MLRWRLLLGALIIAGLVGLCLLDHLAAVPGVWLFPLALVLAVLASGEVLQLAAAGGIRPLPWVVYSGNLLLVASGWLPLLWRKTAVSGQLEWPGGTVHWPILALAAGMLLAVVGEMRRYEKPGRATVNVAAAVFAMVYVGLMLWLVIRLRLDAGIAGLASLVVVVKLADTGAYTVGRLIGRHKMAPVLSSGKTVEGAIGALVFGCLGSCATFGLLVPLLGMKPGPWWGWLAFGLLVAAAGTLGDLAESLLKRDAQRKDSSDWLPGFGGVLDILDSVLLGAPVAYACWALGLVGPYAI